MWHVALASFVNGIAWTTDNPVRRTMIGEVVGPDRMSAAMSLDVGANNASRMLGPTLGGVLLATFGIGGAFAVSVACYLVAVAAAMRIHHRNSVRPAGVASILERMLEGFMLVRRDRRLIGTLVVTIIYNTFGWPFTSMIPVIGQDNLGSRRRRHRSSRQHGRGRRVLRRRRDRPSSPSRRIFARLYIGGVFAYLLMLPVFALAPDPLLAGTVLLMTGSRQCRLQHHAGDARLSRGAARDAQPHLWRAIGLHRGRA